MSSSDRQLQSLFQLTRVLRDPDVPPTTQIEQLYKVQFEPWHSQGPTIYLSEVKEWNPESLSQAAYFAEEITALYVHLYYDPRVIPVTYYKREKRIRRYYDQQFSILFKEIMERNHRTFVKELATEEPIYYLMQIAREKKFPRTKDHHAMLSVLKTRIHLDLSHRLSAEGSEEMRRVLLPHEIR